MFYSMLIQNGPVFYDPLSAAFSSFFVIILLEEPRPAT